MLSVAGRDNRCCVRGWDGGIPTLLCSEAPAPNEAWCHRALVSAWLFDELGLEAREFGHEALGFGWQHPK
jgi:hypothetical protein